MEELLTSGPADTGGSLGSGWPGDATAALQKGAEEARKERKGSEGGNVIVLNRACY